MKPDALGRPDPHHYRSEDAPVDLWLKCVDASVDPRREAWLSEAEQDRALRYRFERDRNRYVNRRAFMREVLTTYLDTEPGEVDIRTTKSGRPRLRLETGLDVNASHSDGLAVLAVTSGRQVGVDIERIRPIEDATELAAGLFATDEIEAVRSAPEPLRSRAFLTIWTRKESFVKATGQGLGTPLDRFDVLAADGGTGHPRDRHGELPYVFIDFDGPGDLLGSVTVSDATVQPRIRRMVVAP